MATLCGMPVPAPGRRSRANSLDGEADFYRIAAEVAAGNFIRGSFATATGLRRPPKNDLIRRRATTLGLPQVRTEGLQLVITKHCMGLHPRRRSGLTGARRAERGDLNAGWLQLPQLAAMQYVQLRCPAAVALAPSCPPRRAVPGLAVMLTRDSRAPLPRWALDALTVPLTSPYLHNGVHLVGSESTAVGKQAATGRLSNRKHGNVN